MSAVAGMRPDHIFDGGDLDCGSGLILLIRQHMMQTPERGIMELRSAEPTVAVELPPWCAMTGHEYLGAEEDSSNHWRHFLRRGADQAAEARALENDKQLAQRYEWRVRVRATANQQAAVYARNFSWSIGQPASFEEKDELPSALESALGALAADVVNGFATRCRQQGLEIDDLEATLKARLTNVLAHLGLEDGDPSLAAVDLTVFITSPAGGADLRAVWDEAQRRSPLLATLKKACAVETRLAIM